MFEPLFLRRIVAETRRNIRSPAPLSVIRFHEFELDLGSYELRCHGRVVKLERRPLDLLIELIHKQGDLLTRDEIITHIWGHDVFIESEHGINTAIRKIRQALRDNPDKPRFVQTVVGRGYRFIAPIENFSHPDAESPEVVDSTSPGEASQDAKARRAPWDRWLAGSVVLALVLAVGTYYLRSQTRRWQGYRQIRSLAVLPLQNLSGDPAQEYFADGITDALITGLSRIGSLRVISRTS